MAINTNEADKYEVMDKIGHGSFGIIHRVKRRTDNKILCRKEIEYVRMSQKEREQLHAEFSILSSLRHPNIVAYYHREHLKPRQELHLYMEYCGGGDLGKIIKGLKAKRELADEAYVWSVISQLVTALYRCHNGEDPPDVGNNVMAPPHERPTSLQSKSKVVILHRDLKPENIFLGEDDQVKLGDFGLSKLIQSNDFASTYVGTPYYMSPEICAAERYGPHSDIWSLGCIIYELCAQAPPFDAKTHYHLVQKIKLGRVDPLPKIYSPELQNLIRSCLNTNPSKRPDTWTLIQMPVIRLMRKEREVVELGKVLKNQQIFCEQKSGEAQALMQSLDHDKRAQRDHMEATLRREWEVKARLEIDRQVALEKEKLMKQYEDEVRHRVSAEVAAQVAAKTTTDAPRTSSPTQDPHLQSSLSAVDTTTHTDISALSLDSPATAATTLSTHNDSFIANPAPVPSIRKSRTPFSRARTQIDSPADIHMASPSPMSIASLSLSPRRAAALTQGVSNGNLFNTATAQQGFRERWQPQGLSPLSSDDEASDEDDVPELPSPTRMPRATVVADPFKPRPGMKRQKTAPMGRAAAGGPGGIASSQAPPSLFGGAPTTNSNTSLQPPSPTRMRRPLSKAVTAVGGGDDMLKAVHVRNMRNDFGANAITNNSNGTVQAVPGRTLVELNQGRTAPPTLYPTKEGVMSGKGFEEVAKWDPNEEPDMPSPFMKRVGRGIVAR